MNRNPRHTHTLSGMLFAYGKRVSMGRTTTLLLSFLGASLYENGKLDLRIAVMYPSKKKDIQGKAT